MARQRKEFRDKMLGELQAEQLQQYQQDMRDRLYDADEEYEPDQGDRGQRQTRRPTRRKRRRDIVATPAEEQELSANTESEEEHGPAPRDSSESDDNDDTAVNNGAVANTGGTLLSQLGPEAVCTASPFMRLPGFVWRLGLNYDPMHSMDGVIKHTVLGTLQGLRWKEGAVKREAQLQRWETAPVQPGSATSKRIKDAFHAALDNIRSSIPSAPDIYRLKDLLDSSTKIKAHTRFMLAGPYGLYALKCVHKYLPDLVYLTLNRILQVFGLLWCKELDEGSLDMLQALTTEAICMVEAYLPKTERDVKLHEIFHIPEQIRNWGECTSHDVLE